MFSRFNQLVRHLSRPLPNYVHQSAAGLPNIMTSSTSGTEGGKRMVHTAGCIIIGDEVLGGKVWVSRLVKLQTPRLTCRANADNRHKFRIHGKVLFLAGHELEEDRSYSR